MPYYDLGSLSSNGTPLTIDDYYLDATATDSTDVFEFSISSTSNINLALTNITAGDDADLRLYQDSNGNGVLDASDSLIASSRRASNLDDSINLQSQAAGTYFAQVEYYAPGSSGSASYDLKISAGSPSNLLPTEVSIGNLNSDQTFYDSVGSTDTADVYAFSLDFYEGVNITLAGLSTDADIRLVLDANGNEIVDSGEVVGSSTRGGTSVDSIFGTDLSGNYLLQVYQYSGNTGYQVSFDHYTTVFP